MMKRIAAAIVTLVLTAGAGYLLVGHLARTEPSPDTVSSDLPEESALASDSLALRAGDHDQGSRAQVPAGSLLGEDESASEELRVAECQELQIRPVDPYGSTSSDEEVSLRIEGIRDSSATIHKRCTIGATCVATIPKRITSVEVSVEGRWGCSGEPIRVSLPCAGIVQVPVVECGTVGVNAMPDFEQFSDGRVALLDLDKETLFDAEMAGRAVPLEVGGAVRFVGVRPGRYRVEWESSGGSQRAIRAVTVVAGSHAQVTFDGALEDRCFLVGSFKLGGNAVPGAVLKLSSYRSSDRPSRAQVVLGNDGAFELELLSGGHFDVWVEARFGRLYSGEVSLEPGFQEMYIELEGARLTGQLMEEGGAPVNGGEILLHSSQDDRSKGQGGVIATVTSGSDGAFAFPPLPVGNYSLEVGGRSQFQEGPSWNRYGKVVLDVSLQSNREIVLELGPPASFCGRVTIPGGADGRSDLFLRRRDGPSGWKREASSAEDGGFCIEYLEPGEYYLMATSSGWAGLPMASDPLLVTVQPERVSDCGVLDLTVGHTVSVSVADSRGAAVPARVRLIWRGHSDELSLPQSRGGQQQRYLSEFRGVPLGEYTIVASMPDGREFTRDLTCDGVQSDYRVVVHTD